MIFRRVFVAVMSLLVAACAITPEQHFSGVGPPPSGMARVYVVSPNTRCWDWSSIGTTILVNKKAAVSLRENTYSQFDLRPSSYIFSTSTDRQWYCNDLQGSDHAPIKLDVKAGQTYFIKYGSSIPILPICSPSCHRRLIAIDRGVAEKQLNGTAYVPAKD